MRACCHGQSAVCWGCGGVGVWGGGARHSGVVEAEPVSWVVGECVSCASAILLCMVLYDAL
jgi:hypothetical protein